MFVGCNSYSTITNEQVSGTYSSNKVENDSYYGEIYTSSSNQTFMFKTPYEEDYLNFIENLLSKREYEIIGTTSTSTGDTGAIKGYFIIYRKIEVKM